MLNLYSIQKCWPRNSHHLRSRCNGASCVTLGYLITPRAAHIAFLLITCVVEHIGARVESFGVVAHLDSCLSSK